MLYQGTNDKTSCVTARPSSQLKGVSMDRELSFRPDLGSLAGHLYVVSGHGERGSTLPSVRYCPPLVTQGKDEADSSGSSPPVWIPEKIR